MEKEKVIVKKMQNMQKNAPNQVWGSFKDVFSIERNDGKFEGKMLNSMCIMGELKSKMSN